MKNKKKLGFQKRKHINRALKSIISERARKQQKTIISDQKINKKYAKASKIIKNYSNKKLIIFKNKTEKQNINIIPKEFEINFNLSDLTKSNYIELNEKLNINNNYLCGVKNCQLIDLGKNDYNFNISFCIIDKSHYEEYMKFKQNLTKFDEDLKLSSKLKDAKKFLIVNESYQKILKDINNIKSLFEDYVDDLIKLHAILQTKYSLFSFSKDFDTILSKIKKKTQEFPIININLVKSVKNISNQINELLSIDNNIKIISYFDQKQYWRKIIFPPYITKIKIIETGGKKCIVDKQNNLYFSYAELPILSYPVETDLIYNSICNNNILFNIFCKDHQINENFDKIEHINYYPVVVSDINRFKIIVSEELINFIKQSNKNIRLTLHFKNKNE